MSSYMPNYSSQKPLAALGGSVGSNSSGVNSHLLKMLCPNTAIGSIIGRGGSVINELNQKTGARIRLSQNQDFFPMTNDRVISISGDLESIETAIGELITRIIEVSNIFFLEKHSCNCLNREFDGPSCSHGRICRYALKTIGQQCSCFFTRKLLHLALSFI
jgi:hypothetical protein